VHDVRFPTWGSAVSCIIQVDAPREGFVNDALMQTMGAPWINTKLVIAVSPDTDINNPGEIYKAIATRADPDRDIIIVGNTRGSPYDPSARPLSPDEPWRVVGKMGIDATIKSRHDVTDFEEAFPKHWGEVSLEDYI
jgi:UbiD family decarboxylase